MLNAEEYGRLARLLNDLHLCTGIKFGLLNDQGQEVYSSSHRAPFCSAVMQDALQRCIACDQRAVTQVMRTRMPYRYLCHAGLYEVAIPVVEQGEIIAIILFGQMLDDAPREEQWERVRRCCSWFDDMDALHENFLRLRRVSGEQMEACAEIARTCVSEVRLRGLNHLNTADDALRLRQYIEAHYAEPLDADGLARALHVGKTKLYDLCRRRYRMTPMQLVTQTRIATAKELLRTTRESVRAIALAVGYADQNYFTKVFRKAVGVTPHEWRSAPSDADLR